MDYYEVLGVSDKATPEKIRKSYQQLILQHHPDKAGNSEKFLKIDEGKRLSIPQKPILIISFQLTRH